jgi:hypothetical protein
MKEFIFGNINKTELCLRFCYTSFRVFSKYAYSFNFCFHKNTNHRCYCPCGLMIDLHIQIFGSSMSIFFSRFNGKLPCLCDEALSEFDNTIEKLKALRG